jgi:UDP-3-O-[3-hydroxymyristoyl] glucosamine N-acyltransferase
VIHASLQESDIRRLVGAPGGGGRLVRGISTLDEAADFCLHFINREVTAPLRERFAALRGCIVIAPRGAAGAGDWGDCVVLEDGAPRAAMGRVLRFVRAEGLHEPLVRERVVAPSAVISPLAVLDGCVEIGEGVLIEPFCFIGPDVRIGSGAIVRSGVRLFPRVDVGAHSIIGTNSVLGHDGYGFVRDEAGNKTRLPHLGGVVIGSSAEVGVLSVVQAGLINPTVVEDHAKVGDHIFIGHNARIGRGASVVAGVAIGGRGVVEAEAWVGLNSSIRDGARVGARALIGMDVSVQEDVPADACARAPRPDVRPRGETDPGGIGFGSR